MSPRRLATALAFVLLPATASAEDLLQTWELARAGDPVFSSVESQRLATREGAVQARAAMLPQLGASGSIGRSRTDSEGTQVFGGTAFPPNDTTNETTSREIGLNLSQMIFDRAAFTRLESQRALSRAADFTVEAAGDDLMTRTSAAYFNVLVAIETLAAAEAQEAALRKQLDFADKRLEVGLAPITDVHEARAQYEAARANVIVTRAALADAYQALAEITGVPVDDLKGLPADFQPTLPSGGDADAWVATALDSNPTLQARAFEVESARADVKTARAARWPTVYFGGNYGDSHSDGSSTDNINGGTTDFENESRARSVGVTVEVPIFRGGAIGSQVRQAVALRDVRADQYEQQRRAIERNTRNAWQTLVAGVSEVEARRLALVSAQSAYDASQVGFEVGTRTVLDVLLNQQTLFDAQRQYALARYNFLQNRLLLERAAGTLDFDDLAEVNRLLTVDADAQLVDPSVD
ncbi:TolC family outer membrane protein [Luteimonas pelagia]